MEEAITGDFALIKAWKADKAGNLVFRWVNKICLAGTKLGKSCKLINPFPHTTNLQQATLKT